MLISSMCLAIAAVAGHFSKFGVFGTEHHITDSYFLLALLCLASGLQNAAITSSSGSSVRTTHLTGLTTDLGLGLARLVTLKKSDPKIKIEVKANWLRVGTVCFFVAGSVVGAVLFLRVGYLGFLLPCAIDLYSAAHGRMLKTQVARK
jgi:uncharacterized membrane protein YoaK (UPF0700 family)